MDSSEIPAPQKLLAGQSETGKACPYCRFPLKEGVEAMRCGSCGALHHADCWQDNAGCAVVACAGGPDAQGQSPPTTVTNAPTQVLGANPPPPTPSAPSPSGGWRSPSLAVAVLILALAVGGAAVAIVLSHQSTGTVRLEANSDTVDQPSAPADTESSQAADTDTETNTETDTDTDTDTDTEAENGTVSQPETTAVPANSNTGLLPAVSSGQMQSEIQQLLLEWHEDVVAGNYRPAWDLMSQRKQQQSLEKYGYDGWVKNQSTLRPYLEPSGLQVSITETNPSTGVATVDVTGMRWNKPGASCSEWSGITWVKYEDDAWRYDPGYSTTPERERDWKPRFSELLGGRC